jgi:signal transduction histidine kinase/CheY-like chemotaxis protein
MTAIDFDGLARKYARSLDVLTVTLIVVGIISLFLFDVSLPRGELDGVGYAALVAVCVRFGNRVLIGCAIVTTLMTLIASQLVPNTGISVAGMWANRGFAIAEIWIVAGILLHRLRFEAYIASRGSRLHSTQESLNRIIREALISDKPQEERIQFLTELSAEALNADICAVLRRADDEGLMRVVDVWDRRRGLHFTIPDIPPNNTPAFLEVMEKDFVAYAEDVRTSKYYGVRAELFGQFGIRAILVADTVYAPGLGSVVLAFGETHFWTDQEIAFGKAVGNLVSLFFASSHNVQTLAALEQVSEGIYMEDKEGRLLYANRAARNLSDDQTGKTNLPRPDTPLTGSSDMHEISCGGCDFELQRMRLPDEGILTRINDVTDRNVALSERRRFEAKLQQSAKMEAIGQLAGGVAHDFNNILGAIIGFAGFLKQDLPEKSPQHGFAERILDACGRGKLLVEQISDFARARAIERGAIDLGHLLMQHREELGDLLPNYVTLNLHAADIPLPIHGNAVQIGQLITNLVLNARDAMGDAPRVIDLTVVRAPTDEIEMLRRGTEGPNERIFGEMQPGREYSRLRVEDTGAGIRPEILDRIFEPFFTTKGRQRGTGLGLAVVHGVVESLGGICHMRSSLGKGSVFSIYFPLVEHQISADRLGKAAPPGLRGTERVLIVDDERDIADILCIGLSRLGYETVGVNDPVEALAAVREDPLAFDMVITDQVMPGLRGLDLIKSLKGIRPDLKTLLCTGYSDGATEEIAREMGADGFFRKPVDAHRIAAGIRSIMAAANDGD